MRASLGVAAASMVYSGVFDEAEVDDVLVGAQVRASARIAVADRLDLGVDARWTQYPFSTAAADIGLNLIWSGL
jgi:hypothetical protein